VPPAGYLDLAAGWISDDAGADTSPWLIITAGWGRITTTSLGFKVRISSPSFLEHKL